VLTSTPGSLGGAGLQEVSPDVLVACPSCRREFPAGIRYCPHDARKLAPAVDVLAAARASGSICPACRRSFDAGVRYCPHHAEELVPVGLWEAMRGPKAHTLPTGVLGKICPHCASRYDLASTFCGKDGSELVTIN
jgi:predicted amidophosphoribosyltransferase